ncbi:hypothetical protein GGR36_003305 [Niveibacterium umoris]|uniref:Uncharacterized protein n=1 Tax=Niveibacterium umoris TaxID=1193620 RepID=A0A840BR75_9RHOO|nr:hypothetical protein [Niveibacterium umoris]
MRAGLGRLARPFGVVGLRSALPLCGGCPSQAGSRPGGRGTFFVRTKKVPKENRPASTPRASHAVPCAARSIGWLRNSARRASDSPRHRRCASEPDASALLGVSEGEGKASMFRRCRNFAASMQAEGRNLGDAVEPPDTPTPNSDALYPGYEHRPSVAPQMVLIFGSRRERRTEVSAGGAVRTRCLRRAAPSSRGRPTGDAAVREARRAANAGRHSLLTFWCCCQKVRRLSGAGPRPTYGCALILNFASGKPQLSWSGVGKSCSARIKRRPKTTSPGRSGDLPAQRKPQPNAAPAAHPNLHRGR